MLTDLKWCLTPTDLAEDGDNSPAVCGAGPALRVLVAAGHAPVLQVLVALDGFIKCDGSHALTCERKLPSWAPDGNISVTWRDADTLCKLQSGMLGYNTRRPAGINVRGLAPCGLAPPSRNDTLSPPRAQNSNTELDT
jgi:hypothetical protein